MLLASRHRKFLWVVTLGILLAFQATGWYFFWGILVVDAKISVKQTMSSSNITLQRLTISATDLANLWVDEREIRFQGHLYDVRRQLVQGDSMCLEVYHDQREEALHRNLHTLLSGEHWPATPLRSWLPQWAGSVYLLPLLPVLPQWSAVCTAAAFPEQSWAAQHQPAQPSPPPEG